MPMAERSVLINAPVDKVFAYLADFKRHPEWAQHDLKLEQSSAGAVEVGATFHAVGHQMGREFESEVRITEFVPNQKIAYDSEGKDFHFSHHLLLQSEDGSTRVTKGAEPKRVGFPLNLLLPLASAFGVLNRGLDGDLVRIKANLEGTAEPAAEPEAPAPPPEPAAETSEPEETKEDE